MSTTRRVPVDSSPTNLSANALEVHQLDQVVDVGRHRPLGDANRWRDHRRRERVAHLEVAFERDRDRLANRHRREQPGVLERTTEPGFGAHVGRPDGDVFAHQVDAALGRRDEARHEVEQRRLARTVRDR